jgi:hypothetical protein
LCLLPLQRFHQTHELALPGAAPHRVQLWLAFRRKTMAHNPGLSVSGAELTGSVRIGSEEHKILFCREFLDSYTEFEPEALPWPDLAPAALERLRSIPYWRQVRHTERRAAAIVAAYTQYVPDPLIRKAIALQGREEARHARLLAVMIKRYGIDAPEEPLEPIDGDLETRFTDFGFGECIDSFLGFGAFKLARRSEFLPEPMLDIFETLMFEETRHIVFFVNWMAWQEVERGRMAVFLRNANALRFYGRAARRLAKVSRPKGDGQNFSALHVSQFLEGFNFRRFIEDCYSENARRMRAFEPRLLRPRFLPALANTALAGFRLWNRRRSGI